MVNFLFQQRKWEHDPETVIGTLKEYNVYEIYFGSKVLYYVIINKKPRFLENYEIKHIHWKFKPFKTYGKTKQNRLFSFI